MGLSLRLLFARFLFLAWLHCLLIFQIWRELYHFRKQGISYQYFRFCSIPCIWDGSCYMGLSEWDIPQQGPGQRTVPGLNYPLGCSSYSIMDLSPAFFHIGWLYIFVLHPEYDWLVIMGLVYHAWNKRHFTWRDTKGNGNWISHS